MGNTEKSLRKIESMVEQAAKDAAALDESLKEAAPGRHFHRWVTRPAKTVKTKARKQASNFLDWVGGNR